MASISDYFALASNGTTPLPTTLASQKVLGAGSCSLNLATGWPTTTPIHFLMYQISAQGALVAGTVSGWKGILAGTTINSLTLKFGNDTNYPATTTVVQLQATSAWETDLINGILQVIQPNGLPQPNLPLTTPILTAPTMQGPISGWIGASETWTYLSANSVTVPTDATTRYDVGDYIKLTQSGTVKYFIVTNVTATVVTMTGMTPGALETVANSAITANYYSKERSPHGLPAGVDGVWVDCSAAATIVGWASFTNKYIRYKQIGKTVYIAFLLSGASNSTTTSFTIPVAASTNIPSYEASSGLNQDNGAIQTAPARVYIDTGFNPSQVIVVKALGATNWTASGNKDVRGVLVYEAA